MAESPHSISLLHKYAYEGSKSKLKNLLKTEKNININQLDHNGNTALYCACARSEKDCVKILLEHGANPNERCQNDETSMHVAARYGQTKILVLLLQYGGDLRLHDNSNRTPKTCAMQQTNSTLRRKTLALIEETRMNAMLQTNKTDSQKLTLLNIMPKSRDELVNPCSVGFGILYKSTDEIGVPIVLPAIKECELEHDYLGETFNNGSFMVYESMKWKDLHLVTVKRLHSTIAEQGHADLLIEELRYLKKINHCPNILALMGFCQYVNSDGLMLMFERVQVGSLFTVLHERSLSRPPKLKSICQIMLNICDALIYLHQMNIIHCYVSSHSVFLTNFHTAKLGNLEYAVEKSSDLTKQKKTKIVENKLKKCAYNWLAPEILENSIPTELSDMYSFCVVIWELFECQIPWTDCDHIEIQHEILIKGNYLPVDHDKIAFPFSRIVKDGFSNPIKRMSFEEVRGVLENCQCNLHSQNVSKTRVKRMYERPPEHRVKANSVSGMETLNSEDLSQNSNGDYVRCDAYKAEILLTKKLSNSKKTPIPKIKKMSKTSPNQQLPPTPPTTGQLPSKLSSTPQNQNFGILSPSPTPRIRPSSVDSPRGHKLEPSTPKNEKLTPLIPQYSTLSSIGIKKIERDIEDKFELIESIYYSSNLLKENNKRRHMIINTDEIKQKHLQLNRSYTQRDEVFDAPNPFSKFNDFRNNLIQPTPDAKRDGYKKVCSPTNQGENGEYGFPSQRLDYSAMSQDENNIDRRKTQTNKEQNNGRGFLEELKLRQEQRSQQSSSGESSSTPTPNIQKSNSYNQISYTHIARQCTSTIDQSKKSQSKPIYQVRSLSNNAIRTNPQTDRVRKGSVGETQQDGNFFAGHGSVKSLVQSYEEQSNKNESDLKVERLRIERLNELKTLKKQYEQPQDKPQGFNLQKELSTISERTEHSNSIIQQQHTTGSPAGVFANTNSKSGATSVTNAIRQLNEKFLDSSTGASGDGISNRNASALNSSTPVQVNTSLNSIKTKPTIQTIQNLKQERKEIQIPIEFCDDEDDEEDESSDSDSDDEDRLIHIGPKRNDNFRRFMNRDTTNRTKSNYSSQEDFLSNTQPCEVTSMECSENVYMTDFDRLNLNSPTPQTNKQNQNSTSFQHLPSDTLIKKPARAYQHLDTSRPNTSSRLNYEIETSSSSIAAADSVPSLQETDIGYNPIVENTVYKKTKNGNVRLDKHVIDTSKFSGYQYKLETKSSLTNQYHIKGCLTNEQTGHSLVVQNTKIKTPNLSTKVIVDKL